MSTGGRHQPPVAPRHAHAGSIRPAPRRRWPAFPFAFVLLLAGCTGADEPAPVPDEQASPFADCATLTAAPPSAAPATPVDEKAGLPELELPCFTGGQPVRLSDLRGPAVINLWASWCEPCRTELPAMQRLAERADGRLHVVGVDTGDGRAAAASFGADKNITMPTLYDRNRLLLASLGRINLPITIFVDSAGRDYVHALPLNARGLSELVRDHTGVAVAP